jgi:hypothetical protein
LTSRINLRGPWTKIALLLAVALLATAAIVLTSARESGSGSGSQGVTWNPEDAPVLVDATKPTLSYGSVTVLCARGELKASTGQGSDKIANAVVDSFERCTFAGQDATVDCGDGSSTLHLIARTNDSPGGTGAVALKSDFACDVTVERLCTIRLAGPQTASGGFTLDEADDVLSFDAPFAATRSGNSLCGPQKATIVWQARFESWSLTIDS